MNLWKLKGEADIHRLTRALGESDIDPLLRVKLVEERKAASHYLTGCMHELYLLKNMRGENASVTELTAPIRHPGGMLALNVTLTPIGSYQTSRRDRRMRCAETPSIRGGASFATHRTM